MQFVQPMPFQEAIDKIGSKSVIGSTLNSEQWASVPLALRDTSFFSSTVESIRFLQRGRNAITDFLSASKEEVTGPDGKTRIALKTGSRADFVKQLNEFAIKEGMGPLDPKDVGTIKDIRSQSRLELIFDTQTQAAHDYGYWKQGQDPDVLDAFPAQRFIREVKVKKPRAIHQQNEGVVRLKTDLEFWLGMNSPKIGGFGVPWGPWGFNSGMGVEDVDRAEAEKMGLLSADDTVTPVDKSFNEMLQASVTGLDDDMKQLLVSQFGDQVDVEGDTVKWAGADTSPAAIPAPTPEPSISLPPPAPNDSNISPVSDALDLKVSGNLKLKVQSALQAIDSVHDDGVLPEIPVRSSKQKYYGVFKSRLAGLSSVADAIEIRSTGPWPTFTMVHETGHFLDLAAIGTPGKFATRAKDDIISGVLKAIKQSAAYQGLSAKAMASGSYEVKKYYDYLMSDVELWARAYAQFIAERASNQALKQELQLAFEAEAFRQWSPQDFEPIALEIETMFKKLGWL